MSNSLFLTGDAVDVAERQVLVLKGVVVGALQLIEQIGGGGGRRDARPHRHRVDQQAHHRFRTGHLGWPARDHGAEGDIMLAGQPHQQLREGALQHGVDGGVVRARQLAKRPRGLLGHPKRCNASPPQPQPIRRAHQGRGVKTGQHLTPGRAGGIEITIGQPADKPAIRHRRRQPLPVIGGKQFPQQDRQRPAIEHDVMISQHKPMLVVCDPNQRRPKPRLVGQIADRGALIGARPRELLLDIDTAGVQLDIPPRRHRIGLDDLHRHVEPLTEARHQVGIAADHRVHGIAQAVRIKPTA